MQRPAAIHVSNVMLWSAADDRGVRVRMKGEGREKARVSARSGEAIRAGGKAPKAQKDKAAKPAPAKAAAAKPAARKPAGKKPAKKKG